MNFLLDTGIDTVAKLTDCPAAFASDLCIRTRILFLSNSCFVAGHMLAVFQAGHHSQYWAVYSERWIISEVMPSQ